MGRPMRTKGGVQLRRIQGLAAPAYRAGEDGRVYSRMQGDWRPLAGRLNDGGYQTVHVTDATGVQSTWSVHRLVCLAWHGLPSHPSLEVRHLDGDRLNNVPGNLAWGTARDNARDKKRHDFERLVLAGQLALPFEACAA